MPGTVEQWPNWSLALPRTLEEMQRLPMPARLAAALDQRTVDAPGNPLPRS
jgi:hypothetical protein